MKHFCGAFMLPFLAYLELDMPNEPEKYFNLLYSRMVSKICVLMFLKKSLLCSSWLYLINLFYVMQSFCIITPVFRVT